MTAEEIVDESIDLRVAEILSRRNARLIQATRAGIPISFIAKQIGTTGQNINNLKTRVALTSPVAHKLDKWLASFVENAESSSDQLFKRDNKDLLIGDVSKMLLTAARLSQDATYSTDERIELIRLQLLMVDTVLQRLRVSDSAGGVKDGSKTGTDNT